MDKFKFIQAIRKRNCGDLIRYGIILLRNQLGLSNRLATPDRKFLEETLIPYYAGRSDIEKILFVGTDWFTRHYESLFLEKEYWTIEPSSWKRQFAGKRHIVDVLQNLGAHFAPGYFDLIICNGVYGWGLDRLEDCEQAFAKCFACLAEGGQFILGWNDLPEFRPVPLEQIQSLRQFAPLRVPFVDTATFLANPDNRHTFNFYIKPRQLAAAHAPSASLEP